MEFEANGAVRPTQAQINAGIERRKAMMNGDRGYSDGILRSLSGPYGLLKFALLAFVGLEILMGGIGVALGVTEGELGYVPIGISSFLVYDIATFVGISYIVIFLICAVLTCVWTFRAMKNLHTVRSTQVDISPAWAISSYFVPIVNLFFPAKAMSQIYHGSAYELREDTRARSPIGIWWGSYLISGLLGQISGRIPDYNMFTAGLDAVCSVISLIAVVYLLKITRETTARQARISSGGIADTFA